MLCGSGICGGTLGISAATGGRSGFAPAVFRFALRFGSRVWARAPLRFHFVSARPDIFFYAEGQALSFPGVISASQQVLNTIFLRTGREF